MTINTITGTPVPQVLLKNYFRSLVNRFFKILPMREENEDSLPAYILNLRSELLGCKSFIPELQKNSLYLSLLSILQYLIDRPECTISETRSEVFNAIGVCNTLLSIYTDEEVSK